MQQFLIQSRTRPVVPPLRRSVIVQSQGIIPGVKQIFKVIKDDGADQVVTFPGLPGSDCLVGVLTEECVLANEGKQGKSYTVFHFSFCQI
jgi:hypothetical protein